MERASGPRKGRGHEGGDAMTVTIELPKPGSAAAPPRGWRIELLGNLRAVSGETVVSRFRSEKTGFLLAYLAFYRQRTHSREALAHLFWPREGKEAARRHLGAALSALRRQLGQPGLPADAVLRAGRCTAQLHPALI